MKGREFTFPKWLGLLIALGGLVSGLWGVQEQTRKSIMAAAEEAPKEVKISNISDGSLVVSWTTDKATSGFVQYGESGAEADLVATDDRDQERGSISEYFTHLITVRGLKPETAYVFRVGSGKNLYSLGNSPYQVTTGSKL